MKPQTIFPNRQILTFTNVQPDDVAVDVGVLHPDAVDDVEQVLGVHGQHVRRRQHAPARGDGHGDLLTQYTSYTG